jgi:hypothetical protein
MHSVQASSSPSGQTQTLELMNLSWMSYWDTTKAVTKMLVTGLFCPVAHLTQIIKFKGSSLATGTGRSLHTMHKHTVTIGSYITDIFFHSQFFFQFGFVKRCLLNMTQLQWQMHACLWVVCRLLPVSVDKLEPSNSSIWVGWATATQPRLWPKCWSQLWFCPCSTPDSDS